MKVYFETKDLVDFGNYLMNLVATGKKQAEPDGTYMVSDANLRNWKDLNDGLDD